jgi:hypothetical protein
MRRPGEPRSLADGASERVTDASLLLRAAAGVRRRSDRPEQCRQNDPETGQRSGIGCEKTRIPGQISAEKAADRSTQVSYLTWEP